MKKIQKLFLSLIYHSDFLSLGCSFVKMDFEKQGSILIYTLHLVTLSLVRHTP